MSKAKSFGRRPAPLTKAQLMESVYATIQELNSKATREFHELGGIGWETKRDITRATYSYQKLKFGL
jgi:hypothetical protein